MCFGLAVGVRFCAELSAPDLGFAGDFNFGSAPLACFALARRFCAARLAARACALCARTVALIARISARRASLA